MNHLEDIVYPQSASFAPADQCGRRIKRIIILPRPEEVDDSAGLIKAISTYLEDNAGWFVAPARTGHRNRQPLTLALLRLDAVDPNTGASRYATISEPQGRLITRIAEETRSGRGVGSQGD